MPIVHKYGFFGNNTIERDDDGYVEILVAVGKSGLYCGIPPEELRIEDVIFPEDIELAKDVIKEMNKKRDLPLYLRWAKIKILSKEV